MTIANVIIGRVITKKRDINNSSNAKILKKTSKEISENNREKKIQFVSTPNYLRFYVTDIFLVEYNFITFVIGMHEQNNHIFQARD